MKNVVYYERITYLIELIRQGNTGSPNELARRIGVSKRVLYRILEEINNHDFKVKFSRRMNSYVIIVTTQEG